jgi:transcriptional regulator with XRE-family HTH domain
MVTLYRLEKGTLGNIARRVRINLGITQQELADACGISKEAVYQFENNLPVYLDARRKILKAQWSFKLARN